MRLLERSQGQIETEMMIARAIIAMTINIIDGRMGYKRCDLDKMIATCLRRIGAGQTAQFEGTLAAMTEKVFT
jgi:hypothetical protein